MLNVKIFSDHEEMSQFAAERMRARILQRPGELACLATGATPMRTYERLADHYASRPDDLRHWRVIKLDEWGGLAMDDPATCEQHLQKTLIQPLGLQARYVAFESQPDDPTAECRRIADELQSIGPIDTCILGMGLNGHLGFNEPGDVLQPHAHIAQLSATSLGHAMLGITTSSARPTFGLTLGVADLLQAGQILLLVSGGGKREAMRRLMSRQITTQFPASLVWLHPDAWLLCDRAAWPS